MNKYLKRIRVSGDKLKNNTKYEELRQAVVEELYSFEGMTEELCKITLDIIDDCVIDGTYVEGKYWDTNIVYDIPYDYECIIQECVPCLAYNGSFFMEVYEEDDPDIYNDTIIASFKLAEWGYAPEFDDNDSAVKRYIEYLRTL